MSRTTDILEQFDGKPLTGDLVGQFLDLIANSSMESYDADDGKTVYQVETDEGFIDFHIEGDTLKAAVAEPDEEDTAEPA